MRERAPVGAKARRPSAMLWYGVLGSSPQRSTALNHTPLQEKRSKDNEPNGKPQTRRAHKKRRESKHNGDPSKYFE